MNMNFIQRIERVRRNIAEWDASHWYSTRPDSYSVNELPSIDEGTGQEVVISKLEHFRVIEYLASKGDISIDSLGKGEITMTILEASSPKINLKALELIARELKDYYSGMRICALLKELGADERLVIYPESKWKIFYNAFSELATSKRSEDHTTLFKIISETIHPLNLEGDSERSEKLRKKLNEYLKYDFWGINENFEWFWTKSVPVRITKEDYEYEKMKDLIDIKERGGAEKISFLRKLFQLLMNTVESFCYNSSNPNVELNKIYLFLNKTIENLLEELSLNDTSKVYGYIGYEPPFANLFAAEKDYREKGKELNWQAIRPEMNAVYGDIEDIFNSLNGSDILAEPGMQKKLNEIQLYLSELKGKIREAKEGQVSLTALNKKRLEQEPIPIQIIGGKLEVNGLKDGLKAIAQSKKKDNKPKFPHKLPAGMEWKNFIIQFLNKEEVYIKVNRFQHNENFTKMGFADNRCSTPEPNEGWTFLWVLAKYNGELTIKDPDAKKTYKKQKQLISKVIKSYFSMESDPFYPYQETKSYKTRFTLLPPPEKSKEKGKKYETPKTEVEQESVDEEIRRFLEEQAPQIYDEG